MSALDKIEGGASSSEVLAEVRRTSGTFGRRATPPAHPGLVTWTEEAIPRYLAAREASNAARAAAGLPRLDPVRDVWVFPHHNRSPDQRGALVYEQMAWGRRYASPDGSVRELRLMSLGSAKDDRPEAEKAAAAAVVAFGVPCDPFSGFNEPHTPRDGWQGRPDPRLERVRVVDVGCMDGSAVLLLDWDLAQVRHSYEQQAKPLLGRAVEATERTPGPSCVSCKALSGCPEPHRAAGLLGVDGPPTSGPRRSLSASDLRAYNQCPAYYHLTRQLHLRDGKEENAAIRRGRAVDAWLNERHRAHPEGVPCSAWDPGDTARCLAGVQTLTDDDTEIGARMITQHADVCPLDGLSPAERVRVQPHLACYDPRIDTVVLATPDLLHTEAGGWVWRETKTASGAMWEGRSLLRHYPQLALAVVMMASGLLNGDLRRSRIELEVLYPSDVTLEELDPGLPDVVDEARRVVAEMASPWHQDTVYAARPGKACGTCEAVQWCAPGRAYLATGSPA